MLYWYIRSVLTDDSKFKKSDLWHFLPALIYFISALPNAFVPWHEKVEVARAVANDPSYIMVYKATLLSRVFPAVLIYAIRLLLVLGYAIWSLGMYINYLIKKKSSKVFSSQHFMKKWLFFLLGFLLILIVTQIFLVVKSFEMYFSEIFFTLNIIRVISSISLIGLLISPFLFPPILYGLPRIQELPVEKNSPGKRLAQSKIKSGQNFEANYLDSISQKISNYMKENQPYLRRDCNLAYFSKLINIPAHHLAYYFREVKNQPFNNFRNELRVNHAKALIEEGKAKEMTLEAIGLQSGFSSRNAFITDFKKIEGESPGAFASRFN